MKDDPTPSRFNLIGSLAIGILAASTAAIFIRFSQVEGAHSIVIAAGRLTIASLLLAPAAFTRYQTELRKISASGWKFTLLAGIFLALHFASWIASLEFTSIASSVVLVSTTPLWVALTAPVFLHERISQMVMIGLVFALAGTIIIGFSDVCSLEAGGLLCPSLVNFLQGRNILGDILALCGAWMAAGYLLVGRKIRAQLQLIPYIALVYGIAAIFLVIIMLIMGKSPAGYSPAVYFWILLLALIPQLLGHTIFNWSLKYLPASFVSITLLGEPIGSTIFAYLIFQEAPGWIKLAGAILLLAGIWLAGDNQTST